jgi:alpha 1,3-glucosidase
MGLSISQLLSLSMANIPFIGVDVPGFSGNPEDELYALFYQLGMLFPFARAHGHLYSTYREPYKKPYEVQALVREAINLRYDLIHYL